MSRILHFALDGLISTTKAVSYHEAEDALTVSFVLICRRATLNPAYNAASGRREFGEWGKPRPRDPNIHVGIRRPPTSRPPGKTAEAG